MTVWSVTPSGKGAPYTIAEAQNLARWGDEFVFAADTFKPFTARVNGATYDMRKATVDGDLKAAKVPGIHVTADHVTIKGPTVLDAKTAGIAVDRADYVRIEDATVLRSLGTGISTMLSGKTTISDSEVAYSGLGGGLKAGISIYIPVNVGWNGSPGVVIDGNDVHHNAQHGPGRHTDGNGIIIDRHSPKHGVPKFSQEVAVTDNDVHHNGSDGVLFFNVDDFEFSDNRVWANGTDTAMNQAGTAAVEFRNSTGHAWGNDLSAPEWHPEVIYVGVNHVTWGVQGSPVQFWDHL